MKTIARQKQVSISAQKAKLVCDLIRNRPVSKAASILANSNQKAAFYVNKLLKSAVSNATNNHAMDVDKLYVYEIFANQGSTLKRTFPRAKGSADLIRKRHTNFVVVLSDDANERVKEIQAIKQRLKKRTDGQKLRKETKELK